MASDGGDNQENSIDFAKLELENITAKDNVTDKDDSASKGDLASDDVDLSANNDMDVDPASIEEDFALVDSKSAVNNGSEVGVNAQAGTDKAAVFMEEKVLGFSDGDYLTLPIIGDVIMDYSMDGAVYHETMQQYRYSPALVIAANEGDIVTAAVDAKVTDIYSDAQTGKTICFDIGGGYELTYGQLENVTVNVGDTVSAGDIVANVAAPTIYYSDEGANIYYKLTKDGEPKDPLFRGDN
jgi:murein DD-endopeptidase MepM/ murein hydrolase activator NlpD